MLFFRRKNLWEKIKDEKMKEAAHKAAVNGLSEKQIKELIKNNEDLAFIDDEIEEMMLSPDIEDFKIRFLPPLKKSTSKKTISAMQVLTASILGDIMGSRFEFTKHEEPAELFTDSCFYTDDTILSVATAGAVLKNPIKPDFRTAYIEAYNEYPDAGYGYNFVMWAKNIDVDNTKGFGSYASGSAMRISYIPAFYDKIEDVIKYTIQSAMVTHNHFEGVKGAVVLAVCIWMARNNYSKEEIYNYCKKHYFYTPQDKELLVYKRRLYNLSENELRLPEEISNDSLRCSYAVPFVIRCFVETDSYEACIRKILEGFGDSDTMCAMAGGLCCAYYGANEIYFDINKILIKYQASAMIKELQCLENVRMSLKRK